MKTNTNKDDRADVVYGGELGTPPHHDEAEERVLGAVLLDGDALDVITFLKPEHFYRERHRDLFRAFMALKQEAQRVDQISVLDYYMASGKTLDMSWFHGLSRDAVTSAHIISHAKIIMNKFVLRKGAMDALYFAQRCYDARSVEDVKEHHDRVSERFLDGYGALTSSGKDLSAKSHVKSAFSQIESWYQNPGKGGLTGVCTGLEAVDSLTLGWQRQNLVILAARPAMGKTALALGWALRAAESGERVMFYSLEMSASDLMIRAMAHEAYINQQFIRAGALKEKEWALLISAAGRIGEMNLDIDDTPGLTLSELKRRARQEHKKKPIRVIVVDYLTLIKHRAENNSLAVGEIAQDLKNLAKELDCTVIALAQLNRDVEKRADKRPMLADLRESGGIEQAADLICFIYRDAYYKNAESMSSKSKGDSSAQDFPGRSRIDAGDTHKRMAEEVELNFAKNRNGRTEVVRAGWIGSCTRFVDMP